MHSLPIETYELRTLDQNLRTEAIDLCLLRNIQPFSSAPDGQPYVDHAARELALLKSALHILRLRGHIP